MILQNWWLTRLRDEEFCDSLRGEIGCDVAVVGGGIAGLHAASNLVEKGLKVVLIEKSFCGGNASGRSSGFLTPESEFSLKQLIRRYGNKRAKEVWGIAEEGVRLIINNIKKYNIECDLQKQDCLSIALTRRDKDDLYEDFKLRNKAGFKCKFYNGDQLRKIHPNNKYKAGLNYSGTYGFISLLYCQGLKRALISRGVRVFENSEVKAIKKGVVRTHLGHVNCNNVIVCADNIKNSLGKEGKNTYHAQTFLSISEPLSKRDIDSIFPKDKFLCWDSKLIYSYYRLTGDNRLLLGGGSMFTTYYPTYFNSSIFIQNVVGEFKRRFPKLKHLKFPYYWPGLIEIARDIMPVISYDKDKHAWYVQGCPGLPWASFCGDYAARKVVDRKCKDYSSYFGADRKFLIPLEVQAVVRKPVTYGINNLYALYFQKDN